MSSVFGGFGSRMSQGFGVQGPSNGEAVGHPTRVRLRMAPLSDVEEGESSPDISGRVRVTTAERGGDDVHPPFHELRGPTKVHVMDHPLGRRHPHRMSVSTNVGVNNEARDAITPTSIIGAASGPPRSDFGGSTSRAAGLAAVGNSSFHVGGQANTGSVVRDGNTSFHVPRQRSVVRGLLELKQSSTCGFETELNVRVFVQMGLAQKSPSGVSFLSVHLFFSRIYLAFNHFFF